MVKLPLVPVHEHRGGSYLTRLTVERARTAPLSSEEIADIYATQERERVLLNDVILELLKNVAGTESCL